MEFGDVVRRRRMVRNFEARPLAEGVLEVVLAAARRGPSAGNTEGIEYLVLVGPDETSRYWTATLPAPRRSGFRWPGLLHAPVLIVPCVEPEAYVNRYGEPDKVNTGLGEQAARWTVPYWHVDGGMAAMLVLLAAQDQGLGALFFGLFDHEPAVRAAFAIPSTHQPIGTIALGYAAPDTPGRSATRPRRSADEVIHRGRW